MNTEASLCSAAETANPSPEGAASAYIAAELPKARTTLHRTRIAGVVLVAVVGIYISFISITMVRFFQPRAAAEVASGMLVEQVIKHGPALVGEVEKEIPVIVRQIPDYIIQEVPHYRQELERAFDQEWQAHCRVLTKDVAQKMDTLIDDNKQEMKALFANSNDRAALRKIMPDLDLVVSDFLNQDPEGKRIRQHISDLAAELQEIQHRTDRLANGNNLTPEEQKTRHALALLSRAIKNKLDAREVSPKKLAQSR